MTDETEIFQTDYDLDNRRKDSTKLVFTCRLDVNPIHLFENMLENRFSTENAYVTEWKRRNEIWREWHILKELIRRAEE
jgi:hypothetical protein